MGGGSITKVISIDYVFPKLTSIQNALFYGGYLTSLGCPAFILSESILLKMPVSIPILLISFLLPLIVYSYNYYGELESDMSTNPERTLYLRAKRGLFPAIIGSYIGLLSLLLILYADQRLMVYILILIVSGIMYTLILKRLTKKVPIFKSVYVSLVWASAGAFIFPIYYSLNNSSFFLLIFAFIFLKGITNATFFDLKDLVSDRERGLKTLPVLMGKEQTIKYLHAMNLIAIIPLILGVYARIIPVYTLSLIAFCFYDYYYIKKAETLTNKDLRIASYALADAEFILWPLLLIIASILLP